MSTSRGKNNKRQQPSTAGLPIKQVNAMEQKGMPSNQIIQELKKQGYTSSQIYYAMNQVNLGGGNVRVRQPLGFNAQQQNSPSKQPYSYAQQQQVPANKNHKKLFLIIIFVIIISIIAIAILPIFEKKISFKPEDVVFVSQPDLEFQSKVKDLTGYDWVSFLDADKSDNAKITALLFLANEIDSLDNDFEFVDRSVGINKSEFPIRLDATDNSKENLLKLIDNLKSVENSFVDKDLPSAKIRANRILVIENFFKKNPLPEGEINEDAANLFAEMLGLTMSDYPRLASLMIVNYNLFLAE
jgi:hypothetical protein